MNRIPVLLARRLGVAFVALLALAFAAPVAAIDPDDLLPVDEAFVLSAEADGRDAIVIRWKIADGYYLYRHRTSARTDAGFAAQALQLPKGKAHEDEFFGRVETYREELIARLPGEARAPRTQLTVKYQGCADAGICYPPQTRTLTVALPVAASETSPLAGVGHAGGARPGGLLGRFAGNAAPLPEAQAFGFDAIVGDAGTLLLRFSPAPGYYLYRDRTALRVEGAPSLSLAAPRWPKATPWKDEHFGEVAVYFDPIDVAVPLRRTSAQPATATLVATFQGCQTDGICYPPMTRRVALTIPAGEISPEAAGASSESDPRGASDDADAPPGIAASEVATTDEALAPAPAANAQANVTAPAPAPTVPESAAPRGTDLGLAVALLLALLGGVILNLMPCVLPVLSLKALSIASSGQDARRARRQAFAYTAGVLVSFAALGALAMGLREAGVALGWGFQLQQPLVVALLGLLMFALGLSLSGVWHIGGAWMGVGHGLATRGGLTGDFFTGVLAVIVATPCTGPFMGAALGWAFTAPTATALAVFLALGLGLALPFLLIGLVPALANRLPKPGAWMDTLKQLLAFPLYATAAWLAWVLARQRGADAVGAWLVAAVLVALALWAWTRARTGRRWAYGLAIVALLATLWPLAALHRLPRAEAAALRETPNGLTPVPFSEQRLADLRKAGRVVFVNMTADWCITCKANERAVFANAAFRTAMSETNAVYMVGDWTDVDPAISAYLQRYKAVGVPLYVVYPADGGPGRVLPTVLTPGVAVDALRQAAGAAR